MQVQTLPRQPLAPRLTWTILAWVLCVASIAVLAVLMSSLRVNPSHNESTTLTFLRPGVAASLLAMAALLSGALAGLVLWRHRVRDPGARKCWAPAILCLLAYPATLLVSSAGAAPFPTCEWSAEYSVVGPDRQVYYVLHAPPPLNGRGHCALARRKSGTALHFTVEVLTDFEWTRECFQGEAVLRAGQRDPDPEVRKVASTLVKSGAILRRLAPGSRGWL